MLIISSSVGNAHKKSVRLRMSYTFRIEVLRKPVKKRYRYTTDPRYRAGEVHHALLVFSFEISQVSIRKIQHNAIVRFNRMHCNSAPYRKRCPLASARAVTHLCAHTTPNRLRNYKLFSTQPKIKRFLRY